MIKATQGKVCVIDESGQVYIRPSVDVDTLYYPSYGYCQVEKDGKYGYINLYGELVIPFTYKKAYPFSENGLAFVICENGLGGYINTNGEFVIDPIFEYGSTFKFGYAAVRDRGGQYKFIYKNGQKAFDVLFKYASGYSDCGLTVIQHVDRRYALMDTIGNVRLLLEEGCVIEDFKKDSRITKFRKNGKEALINAAGEIITDFYDQVIITPNSYMNPFLRDGLWGYVDTRGREIIPNIYLEASEFTEDYVAYVRAFDPLAETGANEFYIDPEDKILDTKLIESKQQKLRKEYCQVKPFINGLALAENKPIQDCTKLEM